MSADFDAAVECAHQQYENYVRQGQLGTEEDRRRALRDAISHAVGMLKLRAMTAQSERDAAEAALNKARKWVWDAHRKQPSRTDIKADLDAIDAVLDAEDRRNPERFDGTEPINEFIARQRAKRERRND